MAVSIKSNLFKFTAVSALVLSSLSMAPSAHAAFPFSSLKDEVPTLADMVEQVTPAVVSISVTGSKEVQAGVDPFQYFFGNRRGGGAPRVQERPFQSLGSGVIIDADKGYVVTNYHVINDANEITVTLKDGRQFEAKKLGGDEQSDIAVLKIDPEDLTEIVLANSDKTRIGDFVVAVGNPFGLGQTVTSGIVSAKGRSGLMRGGLEDFIQTDAAINSGNSGGALLNLKGELVGINTAIIAPGGGNVGIGFAIPSVMMNNLVEQIVEFGEVKRGVLGITGTNLDSEAAEALGVELAQGAFVQQVREDGSADKAGLKSGDVITHVDGVKIKSFSELRSKVSSKGAGKQISLKVNRDGQEIELDVVLGSADQPSVSADNLHPSLKGAVFSKGETKKGDEGIEVAEIDERSPAAMLGLEQGDVIIAVNRKRVKTISEMRDMLSEAKGVMALNVVRGNSSLYILIR